MRKNQFTLTALTISLLLSTFLPAARATDGQIKIGQPAAGESYPIIIDHAGSYVLTDNLTVTDTRMDAILIMADDVTLDLNGHTIHQSASGGTATGISAVNRYSITILNGRVSGFGDCGINLSSSVLYPSYKSSGHIIKDVQALNNGSGIYINGGTLTNCVANNNLTFGIVAVHSSLNSCTTNKNSSSLCSLELMSSTAFNCTANGNSGAGILAYDSTIDNTIANENVTYGIDANDSTVSNCVTRENTYVGIRANRSKIDKITANYNVEGGILSYYSSITNCTASNNTSGPGIEIDFSSVINCIASKNTGSGIVIYSGSRVEDNNCCENTAYGLYLFDASTSIASFLYKNTGYNNALGGIHNTSNWECHIPLPPVDNANRFVQ